MKSQRRLLWVRVWFATFACALAAQTAQAQVVVVTAKSATALRDQLRTLVKEVDPQAGQPVIDALDKLDDPKALEGLDRSKPLGAFASFPEGQEPIPAAVAFIPVTNVDRFLASLEQFGFKVDDKGGGGGFTHKIMIPQGQGPDLYALSSQGYLFVSSVPTGADKLKALKPESLRPAGAGGLVAAIHLDRIPDQIRETFLGQVEQNAEKQRERKPGETDAAYKGRLSGMKVVQDGVTSLVREGRELLLDIDIQSASERLAMTLELGAKADTPLATSLQSFSSRQSRFSGLAKGAAVSLRGVIPLPDSVRDLIKDNLKSARDKVGTEQDAESRRLINLMLDAIEPTLKDDHLDACVNIDGPFPNKNKSAKPDDETLVVLFGVGAKDSRRIESALREAIAKAKPEDREKITFDIDKADGTSIHRIKLDPTSLKDNPQFGDPVMFLAFPEGAALAVVGQEGLAVMRRSLASLRTAPASGPQLALDLSAKAAASLSRDDSREASLGAAREVFTGKDASKDRLQLSLTSERTRARLRLESDLPVLRFFSKVGAATKNKDK